MGLYNKQGLYSGYKKNNKEREALDYYATPISEVTNILETLNLDLRHKTILEPCAGRGRMVKGIVNYLDKYDSKTWQLFATDIKERPLIDDPLFKRNKIETGEQYDFLGDSYPYNKVDYVIMNPLYSIIEPFVIRGLEIAQEGLLVLGQLQFLEGQSRYNNILRDNPPSNVCVYVDRIKCGKNGDFSQTEASAQAYAWYFFNKQKKNKQTHLHWIRRKSQV